MARESEKKWHDRGGGVDHRRSHQFCMLSVTKWSFMECSLAALANLRIAVWWLFVIPDHLGSLWYQAGGFNHNVQFSSQGIGEHIRTYPVMMNQKVGTWDCRDSLTNSLLVHYGLKIVLERFSGKSEKALSRQEDNYIAFHHFMTSLLPVWSLSWNRTSIFMKYRYYPKLWPKLPLSAPMRSLVTPDRPISPIFDQRRPTPGISVSRSSSPSRQHLLLNNFVYPNSVFRH